MEQFKKIRVFFDQDFEAVIKKILLDDFADEFLDDCKKILDNFEIILDNFEIISEKNKNFLEKVKNYEECKPLMAKYEIENINPWFLFAFSIYKTYLYSTELQQRNVASIEKKQH